RTDESQSENVNRGDDLPSERQMASYLGVNLHTVNKAYQLLNQAGFILIHRQKGVVVNPDGMPGLDAEYKESLNSGLRPFISAAICRGMGESEFLKMCQTIFKDIKQ